MEKDELLISIIVPVYNCEEYIEECIKSISKQTYENIEIIIVNDGSKDNSLNIIKKISNQDNRIKYIDKKNEGANIARKVGIEASNGKYVMFVDSDDWIDYQTINELVSIINKNPNIDMIKFSMLLEPSHKSVDIFEEKYLEIDKSRFEMIYELFITSYKMNSICATLIKRKIIDKDQKSLNVNRCFAEDLLINIDIIDKCNEIVFMNKPFYHYRNNQKSTTKLKKKEIIIKNVYEALDSYKELYKYSEKWKINQNRIDFKIFKEICKETAKLVLCRDIPKKEIYKVMKQIFSKDSIMEILNKIKYNDLVKELKKMKLTDYIQYYLYIIEIYKGNYKKAVRRLNIFVTKEKLKNARWGF